MLVEPRVQLPSILHRALTQSVEVNDLETIVHPGDEEALGVGRVPFETPDTSAGVKLGERDLRFPSVKEANVGVVAGGRGESEPKSDSALEGEGLPSNGEDVLKERMALDSSDTSFKAALVDEGGLIAALPQIPPLELQIVSSCTPRGSATRCPDR